MEVKKFNCGQSAGKTSNKRNLGFYFSGFSDGEGSFNVSLINRKKDFKHGWKVSLSFNISQKDDTVPRLFKEFLKCGTIRYRKDGICYFEVRSIKNITEIVIPFFRKFPLISEWIAEKNVDGEYLGGFFAREYEAPIMFLLNSRIYGCTELDHWCSVIIHDGIEVRAMEGICEEEKVILDRLIAETLTTFKFLKIKVKEIVD